MTENSRTRYCHPPQIRENTPVDRLQAQLKVWQDALEHMKKRRGANDLEQFYIDTLSRQLQATHKHCADQLDKLAKIKR